MGKMWELLKSQFNMFGGVDIKVPRADLRKPNKNQHNLFKESEGATKDFSEGDKRELRRTTGGKLRWVNADKVENKEQLNMFNDGNTNRIAEKPQPKLDDAVKKLEATKKPNFTAFGQQLNMFAPKEEPKGEVKNKEVEEPKQEGVFVLDYVNMGADVKIVSDIFKEKAKDFTSAEDFENYVQNYDGIWDEINKKFKKDVGHIDQNYLDEIAEKSSIELNKEVGSKKKNASFDYEKFIEKYGKKVKAEEQKKEYKTKKEQIDRATELGKKAFQEDKRRFAGGDSEILGMVGDRQIGEHPKGEASSADIFEAWTDGWDKAWAVKNEKAVKDEEPTDYEKYKFGSLEMDKRYLAKAKKEVEQKEEWLKNNSGERGENTKKAEVENLKKLIEKLKKTTGENEEETPDLQTNSKEKNPIVEPKNEESKADLQTESKEEVSEKRTPEQMEYDKINEVLGKRQIWIPDMKISRASKLLQKDTLNEDDIEYLKDFQYFLLTDKQSAAEKGIYTELKVSQKGRAYVLKDKFLLTNIENKLKEAENNKNSNKDLNDKQHQTGETKTENGHTYRLNENHKWERVDKEQTESKDGVNAEYKYLLTQRPPSIGTHPIGQTNIKPIELPNGRKGYELTYNRELTSDEVKDYELQETLNPNEYKDKTYTYFGQDWTVADATNRDITLETTNDNGKAYKQSFTANQFKEKLKDGTIKEGATESNEGKNTEKVESKQSNSKETAQDILKEWAKGSPSEFAEKLLNSPQTHPEMSKEILEVADLMGAKTPEQMKEAVALTYKKFKAEKQKQPKDNLEQTSGTTSKGTLSEQVENILNKKQDNKAFKDFNERVGGSKKEMATIRKLSASELLKQDSVTQYQTITKEKVLNEFDPIAHKEAGEVAGLVFMKLKLRQALAPKPENDDEARKLYVNAMPTIMQEIEDAKSVDKIKTIRDKYFERMSYFQGRKYISGYFFKLTDEEKKADTNLVHGMMMEKVFGSRFENLLFAKTDTARQTWAGSRLLNKFDTEDQLNAHLASETVKARQLVSTKERFDKMGSDELINNFGLMAKLELGGKEYEKSFKEAEVYYYEKSKKKDIHKFADAREKAIAEVDKNLKETNPTAYYQLASRIKESHLKLFAPKSFEEFQRNNPAKENDWSFLKTEKGATAEGEETKEKVVKTDLRMHDNPTLTHIKRVNGRVVTNEDVNLEHLADKFGYKSIQLGHYVKDNEAKGHIKHYIGGMKDLEDALGIDVKKLNEIGGLSLAFGARGSGKASAHYEPMRKIINLTKTNGDGSVSHEWGHYLDHLIGGGVEGIEKEGGFATKEGKPKDVLLGIAVKNVMSIIENQGGSQVEKTFIPPKETPKRVFSTLEYIATPSKNGKVKEYYIGGVNDRTATKLDTPEKVLESALSYIDNRIADKDKSMAYRQLAYHLGKPITAIVKYKNTRFYQEAEENGAYWVKPQELFARAFESYVQDKLHDKGMGNNYLVAGNNAQAEGKKAPTSSLYRTYPQDSERTNINKAFDILIDRLKTVYDVAKKDDNQKRVTEEIKLEKSFTAFGQVLNFRNHKSSLNKRVLFKKSNMFAG